MIHAEKPAEMHGLSSKHSSISNPIYSNMKGETQPPSEAPRDSNLEIGRSLHVKDFILQSMTADLEKKLESFPDKLREKGLKLVKRFQLKFIDLIVDRAQHVPITDSQVSLLRSTILDAVSLDFKQTTGEVIMHQNAKDLLIAATYINSLNATER